MTDLDKISKIPGSIASWRKKTRKWMSKLFLGFHFHLLSTRSHEWMHWTANNDLLTWKKTSNVDYILTTKVMAKRNEPNVLIKFTMFHVIVHTLRLCFLNINPGQDFVWCAKQRSSCSCNSTSATGIFGMFPFWWKQHLFFSCQEYLFYYFKIVCMCANVSIRVPMSTETRAPDLTGAGVGQVRDAWHLFWV